MRRAEVIKLPDPTGDKYVAGLVKGDLLVSGDALLALPLTPDQVREAAAILDREYTVLACWTE